MIEDIEAQIEFLNDIKDVTVEFEAAYENRDSDPERWEAAKAAFQERRSFWRSVRNNTVMDDNGTLVQPSPVNSLTAIKGEVN